MAASDARRFARKALRREIGPLRSRLRVRCRDARKRGKVCAVRLARGHVSFRGTIRVWYTLEGAATRWYYSVNVVRRVTDCARRIRRSGRQGARGGDLLRQLTRPREPRLSAPLREKRR
jgi:hypothetical protein